ncbi:MAG: AMP-binding protein, partial [Gemmatimonadetes bacterium]|nr:AMP-binding protein [Gemmatimonadota bacterium]
MSAPVDVTAGRRRPELSPAKLALHEARLRGLNRATPFTRRAGGGDAPLSFTQERLWFLDRLQPGLAAYTLGSGLRLSREVDVATLRRALDALVERHEALRTTFREAGGVPVQVVHPPAPFPLSLVDLSGLSAERSEAAVQALVHDEAARPFDLEAGPLFRVVLVRLGAAEHVLLVSLHHIVGDGWSMDVLRRELAALYDAARDGRPSPLPELPVQYADFATWQRGELQGPALTAQLAYWRNRLTGAPELLELPTDHPRPAVPTFRGGREPVEVPAALLARLEALARVEGATPFMLLLGAFQVLLARYAGADDVVVGTPAAGRTRRETEGLIGVFVNTLALRTDLGGDPTFREVLRRVRGVVLDAFEHQALPFEKIVAELQPERSLSHTPVFQTEFILQNATGHGAPPRADGLRSLEMHAGTVRFDLSLALAPAPVGLQGTLEYSTDLFREETARRMAAQLSRLLEQVAEDPDARISALALMDDAERARVVHEWNRTDAAWSADACLHELVAAQAARTPEATALVFWEQSLTYREVDEWANRLAHHLVDLGAGPEVRVGICLERSAEMVVALLGVLKAGAAYVPLDPAYPSDRLAYMLANSRASLLVTQQSLG